MKYRRKPEVVDARQVTAANAAEVAAWCGGWVRDFPDDDCGPFVVLRRAGVCAAPGEWIVQLADGRTIGVGDEQFRRIYEPVPEPSTDGDLRDVLFDTFGRGHVGPETFDGAAPEWVRLLRQELSGGIARTLPGILRAAYGIVAYGDDAERLIEAWRKREAESR